MKKAALNLTTLQGRRQWGTSLPPHFMFGPRLLHTSKIMLKKFDTPLWVLAPLAAKS